MHVGNKLSEIQRRSKYRSLKIKIIVNILILSLAKEIEAYLKENDIDHEKVSYCITDLKHNIKYSMNEKEEFVAASTYKLTVGNAIL